MSQLILRNLRLYFRDRAAVFFSFLSVLIVFAVYALFLGNNYIRGNEDIPGAKNLMDSWIMAGILAITGMSTTMGALGSMVDDHTRKISYDFYTSPVRRTRLAAGYLFSALIIGIIMTVFSLIFSEVYIVARGGALLPFGSILKLLALIPVSVASSGSMCFLMVLFFKTQSSYSVASSIVGTLLGFLTGVYIPVGALSGQLQLVVKIFPVSYAASLFRKIMMEQAVSQSFASAPAKARESFEGMMGITYQWNGTVISVQASILILLGVAALFYVLAVVRLSAKKNIL